MPPDSSDPRRHRSQTWQRHEHDHFGLPLRRSPADHQRHHELRRHRRLARQQDLQHHQYALCPQRQHHGGLGRDAHQRRCHHHTRRQPGRRRHLLLHRDPWHRTGHAGLHRRPRRRNQQVHHPFQYHGLLRFGLHRQRSVGNLLYQPGRQHHARRSLRQHDAHLRHRLHGHA